MATNSARMTVRSGPGRRRVTRGTPLRKAVGPLTGLAGMAAALPAGYLAALSLAALRRPPRTEAGGMQHPRLVVLVPAYNEAELIGRCLASLQDQAYPPDRYRIVVIADNCTDDTEGIAKAAGAEVLVRHGTTERGKGHGLRWAMDHILDSAEPFDAFVVVDADSVADRGLLAGLAAALEMGAEVAQGEYLALEEGTDARSRLRSAAFLLFHRARFAGRANLGLPCSLVGNGMLFSRKLVETFPWNAFSRVEDLEYSIDLRLRGVRPVFAAAARVRAPVSTSGPGARTQRLRWEGGRLEVVRSRLPVLLRSCAREGRWELWDAAADLAVPPLGLLAAAVSAGTAAGLLGRALGLVENRHLAPWLAASAALPAHVLVGLRAADAPAGTFRALLAAPALVASELVTRLGLLRRDREPQWERTARPGELGGTD
jgi:1,2-diacylglycerol 3-beta-glucosyltransferase